MATVRTAMRVALVPIATLLQLSCAAALSRRAFLKAAMRSSLPVTSDTACIALRLSADSLVQTPQPPESKALHSGKVAVLMLAGCKCTCVQQFLAMLLLARDVRAVTISPAVWLPAGGLMQKRDCAASMSAHRPVRLAVYSNEQVILLEVAAIYLQQAVQIGLQVMQAWAASRCVIWDWLTDRQEDCLQWNNMQRNPCLMAADNQLLWSFAVTALW